MTDKDSLNSNETKTELEALADALTPLQFKTVNNIVRTNSSNRKAYYEAGGTAKNDDTADNCVSVMLSNAKVKAYKRALMSEVALDSVITRGEAMKILSDMASTKLSDIAVYETVEIGNNADGDPVMQGVWYLKDGIDLTEEQAASIMSVKAGSQGIEIKQHDQKTAIKQLAEMMGWNEVVKTEVKHSGKVHTKITFEGVKADKSGK